MEPLQKAVFNDLDAADMRRHLAFCARALADCGAAEISVGSRPGVIPLWKRQYKRRLDALELQFSSGHLGRSVVERLDGTLSRGGVAFKRRYTPKTRQLSRLTVRFEAHEAFTPVAILNTLDVLAGVVGLQPPFTYSIGHRGPFDSLYALTAADPVEPARSYRVGHAIGRSIGSVVRALSSGNAKT